MESFSFPDSSPVILHDKFHDKQGRSKGEGEGQKGHFAPDPTDPDLRGWKARFNRNRNKYLYVRGGGN